MFTVKCPLHFLGTCGANIMTHTYWWKFNSVMWNKNISQILLHSEKLCEILEWLLTAWWPTTIQFPLVSDCTLDDQGYVTGTDKGLIL
jgi:hypothetical protein